MKCEGWVILSLSTDHPLPLHQGRQQMHADLVDITDGIRQMNYRNAMYTLRTYFALTNLKSKGLM